ncbi:MAG: 2TM domain-containing protein [Leptolyngbyaceae cyanobacterium SL_7_1]|nr:2TM domain-containing protein [Leptolyngbyaceae cyanobacterium SL_7_1]
MEAYSPEDVQQILQIAIARQAESGDLSRSQLLEIADEMGISRDELQQAEQEWVAYRGIDQEKRAFNTYRRHRFQQQAARFAIVNGFLIVLNVVTYGGSIWAHYILLIWGLFLALNAWKTFQTQGEGYERAFDRWRRKQQLKRSVNALLNRWVGAR